MCRCSYRAVSTHKTALALCVSLAIWAPVADAQQLIDADEEARQLVVMVTCNADGQRQIGAGIILGRNASGMYIATAEHIVRACRGSREGVQVRLRVKSDADVVATVVAESDAVMNLAMVRLADVSAFGKAIETLPYDRLGDPSDRPEPDPYEDEAIAFTFDGDRPWHMNRASDLRIDNEAVRIRYQAAGVEPGRSVPDPIARGHAGGALFSAPDRLLIGMIVKDQSTGSYHDGEALPIDALLDRVKSWQVPVQLIRPTVPDTFSTLAIGLSHMCGLTEGRAYCWGENESGQLGSGTESQQYSRVLGGLVFKSLNAVNDATCGLTTAGAVFCWGQGAPGFLEPDPENRRKPRALPGDRRFESISLGAAHACGVTADASAYCWGANDHGELGDGSERASESPVPVVGGHRFNSIAAGAHHTCALTPEGVAYCWGDNTVGALGNGSQEHSAVPVPVAGGRTFRVLSASGAGHTCAIAVSGAAYCWGMNGDEQLGNDGGADVGRTPSAVAGALSFAAITSGDENTCGITEAGPAYCWGSNTSGQLGNGKEEPGFSSVPVRVMTDQQFVTLASAYTTSDHGSLLCGLTRAGAAYCWGDARGDGQAGASFPKEDVMVPLRVHPMPTR